MSQSYTIGWVTQDLELKKSAKNVSYVRFSIAERVGFGGQFRMQYLQVWAFGIDAEKLIAAGVGKGALIWVSGQLTLEEYERMDKTPDKRLKVILDRWGLVPGGRAQTDKSVRNEEAAKMEVFESGAPVRVTDGEREELPG